MRDEEFAEAYGDGIRAMIGDQEEVGIDVAVDGHLWYDKRRAQRGEGEAQGDGQGRRAGAI